MIDAVTLTPISDQRLYVHQNQSVTINWVNGFGPFTLSAESSDSSVLTTVLDSQTITSASLTLIAGAVSGVATVNFTITDTAGNYQIFDSFQVTVDGKTSRSLSFVIFTLFQFFVSVFILNI
jgi:hypothetical protein